MADEKEELKNEFQSFAEETAAVFGNTLRSIASDIAQELRENTRELDDLGKSLLRTFKNDLNSLARTASKVLDIQDNLLAGTAKQADIAKAQRDIESKINRLKQDRNEIEAEFGKLQGKQLEDYNNAIEAAEAQKSTLESQASILAKTTEQLGLVGGALTGVGKILKSIGLNDPFEGVAAKAAAAKAQIELNNEELKTSKNLTEERKNLLEEQNKKLKDQSKVSYQINTALKEQLTINNLLVVVGTKILNDVLKLNKAQTEFRRLTGESAQIFGTLNDRLVTTGELIQTQVDLTEQFGLNASRVFTTDTLLTASELTKAVGLTANESGNLARFSTITGENLESQLDSLTKSVPRAFSQRQILRETANVSSDIALAFDNQVDSIGQAIISAKQLGFTLQDINGIADNLLDIESSIRNEFEAEVITGRQLNLGRARLFAMTNELGKLTEEIQNNESIIKNFATDTRIEQQATAKALGLSREQLADIVMNSKLVNTLTDEERANVQGVTLEQLKQLDIQQSIQTSINKITESLAGPIEGFAQLIQVVAKLSDEILAIGTGILAYNVALKASNVLKSINIKLTKRQGLGEAALAAIRSIANPAAIIGIAAGGLAYAAAKGFLSKVEDGIAPASKGPFTITDSFGATAITAKGDGLAVSPNIQREDRNTPISVVLPDIQREDRNISTSVVLPDTQREDRNIPTSVVLSDAQIQKIANAVREGASQATINLDGDRVSSRLQTPSVINQRQFSI